MKRLHHILLIFTVLLSSSLANAQIFPFRNFDFRHGLQNLDVRCIDSDVKGYVYVGTANGAYRFNGQSFVVFSTPSRKIRKIHCFENEVYIGTEKGLTIYKNEKGYNFLKEQFIVDFLEYEGQILIVTKDGIYLKNDKGEYERIFTTFSKKFSCANVYNGSIWLGTERKGIEVLTMKDGEWTATSIENSSENDAPYSVRDMAINKDGELWLVSIDRGVQYYDDGHFHQISYEGIKDVVFSSMEYDEESNSFWLGSWGYGLINLSRNKLEVYTDKNGLQDNYVRSVHKTANNKLIIGSLTQGISIFDHGAIYYNEDSGLLDNNVRACISVGDKLVVSTLSGLNYIDELGVTELVIGDSFGPLVSLNDDEVIAGSFNGDLYKVTSDTIIHLTKDNFLNTEILSLYYYKGIVYIGTSSKGVYTYKDDVLKPVLGSKAAGSAWSIYIRDDEIYLGTDNGVYTLPIKGGIARQKAFYNTDLSDVRINQVGSEPDSDGILFSTETNGIGLFNPKLKRIQQVLKGHITRGFVYDGKNLIAASNSSVYCYVFGENPSVNKIFDIADLGAKEINPGGLYLKDGYLYISCGFGLVKFDLHGVQDSEEKSERHIYLKKVLTDLDTLSPSPDQDSFNFSHKIKKVEFTFEQINLNSIEQTLEYKIIGETDWKIVPKNNVILIHNPRIGIHALQYRLTDSYGRHSEPQVITYEVKSPFWYNWEFLSLIIGAGMLILAILLFTFGPKTKTIEKDSLVKQTLFTARLIIIFGSIAYPLVGYIDTIVDETIVDQQLEIAIGISILLLITVIWSFRSNKVAELLPQIVIIGYLTIVSHLFIVIYINNIVPTHVVGLILLLSVSSIIFNSMRHIIIFGVYVVLVAFLMGHGVNEPYYTSTQYIVATTCAVTISIVLVAVRLNIFSRMEISDGILRNLEAVVFVSDKNGDVIHIGNSISQELGYSPLELQDGDIWSIFEDNAKATMLKSSRNEKEHLTFKVRHKNGEEKHYRWISSSLRNGNIIFSGYDVDYQIQLEEDLNRMSLVAKYTDAGTVISDADSRILWTNPSFTRMTEYTLEEVKGQRAGDLMSGEATDYSQIELTRKSNSSKQGYQIEVLNYTKSGKPVWFSVVGTPILNQEGELTQIIEVVQDITEKKKREEELEQLSLVANTTDNYVIITNADDEVIWVNEAFTHIFGFEQEEVSNIKISNFLSTEMLNPNEIINIRRSVFEEKRRYVGEFCDKTKNDNIIWISASIIPVLDDDQEIMYVISVGSDITDKKLREFQLNQISKANELMHSVDSLLMSESVEHNLDEKLLNLILKSNEEFHITAFSEIEVGKSSLEFLLINRNKEETRIIIENSEDFASYDQLKDGQTIVVNQIMDLDELGEMDKMFMFNGARSYLMTPIILDHTLHGILIVGANIPAYFSDAEIDTYSNIANSISIVLKQRAQSKFVKESEENFRQLNESISEAFWLTDRVSGQLIYANKVFEKTMGVSTDELYKDASLWSKNIHEEDKERVVQAYNNNADRGFFNEEYRLVVNGETKWVHSVAYPISDDDGNVIKLSGSSRDITENKLTETAINRLNEQLSSVNILNQTILNNGNVGEELYNIIENLFLGIEILRLNITIYDFEKNLARYHFIKDNTVRIFEEMEFPLDVISENSILKLGAGEFVLVSDIKLREGISESDKRMLDSGINTYMMYPLQHQNALLGSLNISFKNDFGLTFDHVKFLKMLAEGISISIYQKLLQEEIEHDRQELAEINKDISDSIYYAKKFQDAKLPELTNLQDHFEGAGVLYWPRDIVSGDFYWTEQVDDTVLFAAGDCTGHGVPGAFMTLLFNFLLDSIVKEGRETQPDKILQLLDTGINDYFKSNTNESIRDGMDIVLCSYIVGQPNTICFSGARRPLFVFRAETGEPEVIESNKISIGESLDLEFDTEYKSFDVPFKKGDVFYLCSDGYIDQFGGEQGRKFGKKRLIKLIRENGHLPVEEQVSLLGKNMKNWQGDHFQLDDIVVMVVKP